jgi:hypothetical protein
MIFRSPDEGEVNELYDLEADIGEQNNLYDQHPDVVEELNEIADASRQSLGDGRLDIEGDDVRPLGHVENAAPLTEYDPNHPYIIAEYDLPHRG